MPKVLNARQAGTKPAADRVYVGRCVAASEAMGRIAASRSGSEDWRVCWPNIPVQWIGWTQISLGPICNQHGTLLRGYDDYPGSVLPLFVRLAHREGAILSPLNWRRLSVQQARECREQYMSSSIAITVGESLAKGALGQVGGLALGQILVLVGADISGQQEMSRKLDQILADLAVLRTAVDRLTADLQKVGADLAYDFSVNGVLGLIAVNTTLNGAFKSLLIAKPAEQQKLKGSIATELAKLTTGLATWDNCLRGISGQTGLINGWGRKVRANCADWFSPVSALAIELHWDYFDAQQALTVAYLVEFYNQNDEPTMAKKHAGNVEPKSQITIEYAARNPSSRRKSHRLLGRCPY